MPMNEELLKVKLSPGQGQFYGTFSEGMPIAEVIDMVVGFHIDTKGGDRIRRYGRIGAVTDVLLTLDNEAGSHEQVVSTRITFHHGDDLFIRWADTAVAVAEVAIQEEE